MSSSPTKAVPSSREFSQDIHYQNSSTMFSPEENAADTTTSEIPIFKARFNEIRDSLNMSQSTVPPASQNKTLASAYLYLHQIQYQLRDQQHIFNRLIELLKQFNGGPKISEKELYVRSYTLFYKAGVEHLFPGLCDFFPPKWRNSDFTWLQFAIREAVTVAVAVEINDHAARRLPAFAATTNNKDAADTTLNRPSRDTFGRHDNVTFEPLNIHALAAAHTASTAGHGPNIGPQDKVDHRHQSQIPQRSTMQAPAARRAYPIPTAPNRSWSADPETPTPAPRNNRMLMLTPENGHPGHVVSSRKNTPTKVPVKLPYLSNKRTAEELGELLLLNSMKRAKLNSPEPLVEAPRRASTRVSKPVFKPNFVLPARAAPRTKKSLIVKLKMTSKKRTRDDDSEIEKSLNVEPQPKKRRISRIPVRIGRSTSAPTLPLGRVSDTAFPVSGTATAVRATAKQAMRSSPIIISSTEASPLTDMSGPASIVNPGKSSACMGAGYSATIRPATGFASDGDVRNRAQDTEEAQDPEQEEDTEEEEQYDPFA